MDEKELDDSSAVHKRSKSVPAMSPAILDTRLQEEQNVGRPRSNTVDSVDRLVRTQRRGARLSSGGLMRNQSKKRRNKGLGKSCSVDAVDRDERNNSSRKSNHSSDPSEAYEEDRTLTPARKLGFCVPAVDRAVKQFKNMENELEFPNTIDSDQTNSSIVCSSIEESVVGDQELKSTDILHDEHETANFSEDSKPNGNSHLSKSTDNGQQRKQTGQEQTYNLQRDSKINIRRKSLPADLSDYQMDSYVGDYNEGHEHRTRLANIGQTDIEFQNNYRVVYKNRCQNNWRRWHSLPESLFKERVTGLGWVSVPTSLADQETYSVEPLDQNVSKSMQDGKQHHENGNKTLYFCNESLKDDGTMVDKPLLERQHPLISEENSIENEPVASKRPSTIIRSYSLPEKFNIVDCEDERPEKETRELKRTQSLTTGDEFDEVFPVMLSEQNAVRRQPDIEHLNDDLKDNNVQDGNAILEEKPKRHKKRRRRRAKSLPVTLALEEIPEESPEQYSPHEYESIDDMAKKHINKAFQELLRKIQVSQRPRNQVKRSHSLSTIKEITVSNETLDEGESRQEDEDVTLGKALEQEQENSDVTKENTPDEHGQSDEQDDYDHEKEAAIEGKSNEGSYEQVCEHPQEQKQYTNEVDDLQQANEQYLNTIEEDEQSNQEQVKDLQLENKRLQHGKEVELETPAIQQETHENNEDKQEQKYNEDYQLHDNPTEQGIMIDESLNEVVIKEKSIIRRAKEELHIDVPQIYVEDKSNTNIDTDVGDVDDDVDGREEQEGSAEYKTISPQTEELKSPDDEDIQGTILEHINNIAFTFDDSINQTSIVNVVSCMERIPEDPDKENVLESAGTELKSAEIEMESEEIELESGKNEVDATDLVEEQPSTLKRAGSIRRGKGSRGKISGSSRKKSWPLTNNKNDQLNRGQKRVTFDFTQDNREDDQEDVFLDQYEQGPSVDFTFTGSADASHTASGSEDLVMQDDFEDGPRGDIRFVEPGDYSDHYEASSYDQHPEECEDEPIESKFDVLLRNAVNSYLEPDYSQSESPIHQAVALGSVDHVMELIDNGADVNAVDEYGWPPLHVATLFNHVDCAALLLDAGADLQGYTDSLIHEYQTLRETVY